MSFCILVKRDKSDLEDVEVYGPFDTLDEVDIWEEKFAMVDTEYLVTEIHKEPIRYTQFRQGIKAFLEIKHGVQVEDDKFDFLGNWQADVSVDEVIEQILNESEDDPD